MAGTVWAEGRDAARSAWQSCGAFAGERNPVRVAREVFALTFRGSRGDLEHAAALRLQAAVVLLFLAVRCVHLGQAGIDLALAGHQYTVQWLAVALGGACVVESLVVAALTLGPRRLTRGAMLIDTIFGLAGLAAMAIATSSGPGRAGSLNWMLPYTVASATGLGVLAGGDLVYTSSAERGGGQDRGAYTRPALVWPFLGAAALAATYVVSAYLPHRLADDHPGQIWGDAANYVVFFAAGALTLMVARRRVAALSAGNAEVTAAAGEVAREAQWRAVSVDVFGPVIALLDRVVNLPDGEPPAAVRQEANRLIAMIDAVRPGDPGGSLVESEAVAR